MIIIILIQYASTNYDGKSGESKKGSEVKRKNLYNFGQSEIYRFRSKERRKEFCKIADELYKFKIGYSQAKRYDLWNLCVKAKWNLSDLKNLLKKNNPNTDCSQYYACLVNLTYGEEVLPKTTTTASLHKLMLKHPKRFKILPYSNNNIRLADALNAPNHHVASVVRR